MTLISLEIYMPAHCMLITYCMIKIMQPYINLSFIHDTCMLITYCKNKIMNSTLVFSSYVISAWTNISTINLI